MIRKSKKVRFIGRRVLLLLLFACLIGGRGVSAAEASEFALTVLHINDTHSHLDPTRVSYTCGHYDYKADLGGISRLGTAVGEMRRQEPHILFLHGGDMVQGTLYFTKYRGQADVDLFNAMGLDAATLGNHDFDQGTGLTASLVDTAKFPFISANVDASRDPSLAGKIKPYFIKSFAGERVAVIGATTPYTAHLSRPGGRVSFGEVAPKVAAAVRELQRQGIDKIILLSHIGYEEDLRLARTVPGIDVIVGGHSHTLLGGHRDTCRSDGLCLNSGGDYPTVVSGPAGKTVLVVQAWEWGKYLGNLKIAFDERGEVKSWQGNPVVVAGDLSSPVKKSGKQAEALWAIGNNGKACLPPVVKQYDRDPEIEERLALYAKPLDAFQHTRIVTAVRDYRRGDRVGPGQLVAASMLWKTRHLKTQAALQNAGGVRCDIPAGDVTIRTVYEMLPFANTVYVLDLTGRQLRRTLEEMIRGQIATGRPSKLYTAGLKFHIHRQAPFGKRVTNLRIKKSKGYERVEPADLYRIAVQNYLAGGGDGCRTLRWAGHYRYDTGFVDAEVFVEYLKQMPGGVLDIAAIP
ncbi:MAG TPA: bifunctional metallophosphatase/5'-nucleotidase [Syntrophales bacterium]|nr:bifunctional metallophosphatase/5'-nucleotidase [Syntrophales bacterium]